MTTTLVLWVTLTLSATTPYALLPALPSSKTVLEVRPPAGVAIMLVVECQLINGRWIETWWSHPENAATLGNRLHAGGRYRVRLPGCTARRIRAITAIGGDVQVPVFIVQQPGPGDVP